MTSSFLHLRTETVICAEYYKENKLSRLIFMIALDKYSPGNIPKLKQMSAKTAVVTGAGSRLLPTVLLD